MITKDPYTYSIKILRQEKSIRDLITEPSIQNRHNQSDQSGRPVTGEWREPRGGRLGHRGRSRSDPFALAQWATVLTGGWARGDVSGYEQVALGRLADGLPKECRW
jgi:hypothetical protein